MRVFLTQTSSYLLHVAFVISVSSYILIKWVYNMTLVLRLTSDFTNYSSIMYLLLYAYVTTVTVEWDCGWKCSVENIFFLLSYPSGLSIIKNIKHYKNIVNIYCNQTNRSPERNGSEDRFTIIFWKKNRVYNLRQQWSSLDNENQKWWHWKVQ